MKRELALCYKITLYSVSAGVSEDNDCLSYQISQKYDSIANFLTPPKGRREYYLTFDTQVHKFDSYDLSHAKFNEQILIAVTGRCAAIAVGAPSDS